MLIATREVVSSRELLWTLIGRQLRLRSKRAWLGIGWPALAPLVLLALYVFVFQGVFRVGIPRYGVYLFAGLLPWTFVAQALGHVVTSVTVDHELVRRAPFPYQLLPIASVASIAVFFLATEAGFVVYLAVTRQLSYRLLPLLIVPLAGVVLLTSAIGLALALVDVYHRDLRYVLANILTVWFFVIPIVYSPDMAHGAVRVLRWIDPMSVIVAVFRDVLYAGVAPRPGRVVLLLSMTLGLFLASVGLFRRAAPRLPKDI